MFRQYLMTVVLLFGCAGLPLGAQQTGMQSDPLADLLVTAESNSPVLIAAQHELASARQAAKSAGALPNPEISYGYFIQSVETRVGPQRHRFGFRQPFPWFGTLNAMQQAALAQVGQAEAALERTQREVMLSVRNAWWDYAETFHYQKIIRENLALLAQLESVVYSRYRTSASSFSDLLKIQIEQEQLKEQLADLLDIQTPLRVDLNSLLNRAPETALPEPLITQPEIPEVSETDLRVYIMDNHPDLMATKAETNRLNAEARLARKMRYPAFAIGVDFIETGEAVNPNTRDSGKLPIMLNISAQIPLWFGKYRAAENAARGRVTAEANRRKALANQLESNLARSMYALRETQRKTALYRDTLLPKAHQSLEVTRAAFESGSAGFLDVIDAYQTLLDFELTVLKQAVQGNKVRAMITALTGL